MTLGYGRRCTQCHQTGLRTRMYSDYARVEYIQTDENTFESDGVLLATKCVACGHEEVFEVKATFTVQKRVNDVQ